MKFTNKEAAHSDEIAVVFLIVVLVNQVKVCQSSSRTRKGSGMLRPQDTVTCTPSHRSRWLHPAVRAKI